MKTPEGIIEDAINIIQTKGHIKGALRDVSTGAVCAEGALRQAAYGVSRVIPSTHINYRAFQDAFTSVDEQTSEDTEEVVPGEDGTRTIRCGYGSIVTYNDADETTAEDVMLIMKRAIPRAEEKYSAMREISKAARDAGVEPC